MEGFSEVQVLEMSMGITGEGIPSKSPNNKIG